MANVHKQRYFVRLQTLVCPIKMQVVNKSTLLERVVDELNVDNRGRDVTPAIELNEIRRARTVLFSSDVGAKDGARNLSGHEAITHTETMDVSVGALSAVVCPLVKFEIKQVLRNFEYWDNEAVPLVGDWPKKLGDKPRLIFSFNMADDPHIRDQIEAGFFQHRNVKSSFSDLEIRFCDLPPEKDLYIRRPKGNAPKWGNKSGPNWQFYETMKACRDDCRFVFLMETDCVPLRPDWLKSIAATCARNSDAWIIGAHYSGASPLHWSVARHINGNALYNVGNSGFWWFIETLLWPWMHRYITSHDPNLAYDCAWETYLNREEMTYPGHHDWVLTRDIIHRLRLTETIVNIGGHAEQTGQYIWTRKDLLKRFPGSVVAHGPLAGSLLHQRGAVAVGRPDMVNVGQHGPNWLVFNPTAADMAVVVSSFSRSLWLIGDTFQDSDTISVTAWLGISTQQVVEVVLQDREGGQMSHASVAISDAISDRARVNLAVTGRHLYLCLSIKCATLSSATLKDVVISAFRGEEVLFTLHDPFSV